MTKHLRAFHGDPAIKAKYIARVMHHQAADNLIRGTGWDGGKGCAVGCTLEAYDHARYPIELGIPEWLARVEDRLFEGMGKSLAMQWPLWFLEAAPVGADLDSIKPAFLIMVLRSARENVKPAFADVLAVIDRVIELWQRADLYSAEWHSQAMAASASAWAAEAAWASAWAAEAKKIDFFADNLLKLMRNAKVQS